MPDIYKTEAGGRALVTRYREMLAAWPVPSEQLHIATSQGETFVVASGDATAPPLVLLHGAGGNSLMWLRDVAPWSQHFRVCAVDVIGEPGLSAPSRPPLESDAYARWLSEVLDGLGIRRTALLGVSLGGWLALDFATRHPGRVEKLALICPGGVGKQKFGFAWKAMILLPFGKWGRRKALKAALGANVETAAPGLTDYMIAVAREFRPRRMKLPVFVNARLKKLAMPVLLIVGGRDAMLDSKATLARLASTASNLTSRFLPDAGHLIVGQTETILAFLSEPA